MMETKLDWVWELIMVLYNRLRKTCRLWNLFWELFWQLSVTKNIRSTEYTLEQLTQGGPNFSIEKYTFHDIKNNKFSPWTFIFYVHPFRKTVFTTTPFLKIHDTHTRRQFWSHQARSRKIPPSGQSGGKKGKYLKVQTKKISPLQICLLTWT